MKCVSFEERRDKRRIGDATPAYRSRASLCSRVYWHPVGASVSLFSSFFLRSRFPFMHSLHLDVRVETSQSRTGCELAWMVNQTRGARTTRETCRESFRGNFPLSDRAPSPTLWSDYCYCNCIIIITYRHVRDTICTFCLCVLSRRDEQLIPI